METRVVIHLNYAKIEHSNNFKHSIIKYYSQKRKIISGRNFYTKHFNRGQFTAGGA